MKDMISVVIPTYNRSKPLLKAIKSVLSQVTSYKTEIIVCDDGSTDDTDLTVKNIQKKNKNLRYFMLPHSGGPAIPRNYGTKMAKGNWVAYLDSDDIWAPEKLQSEMEYAKRYNLKMVCSNAIRSDGVEKKIYFDSMQSRPSLRFSDLLKDNVVICSSVLVHKETILGVDGFPEEGNLIAIEDYICWLKISLNEDIGYMSERLLTYSDNPKSTIRSNWSSLSSQYRSLIPNIYSWYFNHLRFNYRYLSSLIPLILIKIKNL